MALGDNPQISAWNLEPNESRIAGCRIYKKLKFTTGAN